MRSRVLAAALLLPLLAAGLAGCTLPPEVQRIFGPARPAGPVEVQRLAEEVVFAASDSHGVPPRPGRVAEFNFTLPPGARDLRLDAAVRFEAPAALPVPPPGGVPLGVVNVTIAPPAGSGSTLTFTEDEVQTYSAEAPAPGTWGVRVEAVGQGRVILVALALEPAP